mgnify:CR=1 FL=1
MAKVIVIKGDPNAGKTTASRYVLESLLLMGANLTMYQSANSSPKTQLDGDFEAKVEIAGKTVAVCSQGDVLKWVLNNIKKYIACDVVVDAQLKQDSIYVFGAKNKKFTDVDFELYGLSADEIAIVRSAFNIAQKGTKDEMVAIDNELKAMVEKAKLSVATGERQVI